MRRTLIAASALIVLIFALDAALWALATSRLAEAFATIQAQLRDDGWRVSAGEPARGGWPLQARLAVSGLSIEGGERILPGGLAWQAQRIELGLSWLHPRSLVISPAGAGVLRVSHAPPIVFSAEQLRATLPFGEGRPTSFDLIATSMIAGLAGSAHPRDVRIGHVALHLSERGGEQQGPLSADLSLHAEQLDLPDTRRWPLGAQITSLSVAATLSSPFLTAPGGNPQIQAETWRDGGGTLTLNHAAVRWGPLDAGGSAVLTLDGRLQPVGSGRAQLTGYDQALDALAGGGAISDGLATTVKAVLGLMAPKTGGGTVALPFTLKDNTLSAGPIPLVRLSDIVWRAR